MGFDDRRSATDGRNDPPQRPVELFTLTDAPEYDDEVKEWKVTAVPVRMGWGSVSGGGDWMGGGHRGEGGVKRRWRQENDERESTLWLPDWWRKSAASGLDQQAMESPPPLWQGERVYVAWVDGYLHVISEYASKTVGFTLKVDHPGTGEEMDVYPGIWNIGTQEWEPDCDKTFKAIHWRNGTPEPLKGATGLGEWRESTANGAIIGIIVGDCVSPGEACL